MKTWKWSVLAAVPIGLVAMSSFAATKQQSGKQSSEVRRGEYLVVLGGCNDCHTPWKMGPKGPENDMTRMLSGHPQDLSMPPAPKVPEPWGAVASATFTAWAGPWGTSFSANLTPDPETGLGKWTAQNFIEAMRTGRHMGRGRPIMPPMPWPGLAKMTDGDLKAMFAYLKTIPPIKNRVPDPVAPAAATAAGEAAPTQPVK